MSVPVCMHTCISLSMHICMHACIYACTDTCKLWKFTISRRVKGSGDLEVYIQGWTIRTGFVGTLSYCASILHSILMYSCKTCNSGLLSQCLLHRPFGSKLNFRVHWARGIRLEAFWRDRSKAWVGNFLGGRTTVSTHALAQGWHG